MASEGYEMKEFSINGKRYAWRPEVLAANLRPIGYVAATVFATVAIYLTMLLVAAFAA